MKRITPRKLEKLGFIVSESEIYPDTLYAMKGTEILISHPTCRMLNVHMNAIDGLCYELKQFLKTWGSVKK